MTTLTSPIAEIVFMATNKAIKTIAGDKEVYSIRLAFDREKDKDFLK